MELNLKTGMIGQSREKVTSDNTALRFGSGTVKVYATPAMIGLMEKASINCVDSHLPEGYSSVGTKVDIRHLAATPIGMEVKAEAELVEIEGLKLKFRITAYDSKDKIGDGSHTRYVVNLEEFLRKADSKLD